MSDKRRMRAAGAPCSTNALNSSGCSTRPKALVKSRLTTHRDCPHAHDLQQSSSKAMKASSTDFPGRNPHWFEHCDCSSFG
eukprot:5546385-Pyramimonas_sp.AAC.1